MTIEGQLVRAAREGDVSTLTDGSNNRRAVSVPARQLSPG
jgi:hypothetical protein